ncbi:MAG: hypothetical protein WCK87_02745 [Candidatus Saccharibacteria bacterium]
MGSEFSTGAHAGGQDRNNYDRLTLSDAGRREGAKYKTQNYISLRDVAKAVAALAIIGIGANAKSAYDSRPAPVKEGATEEPIVIEEPGFAPGDKKVVSNHAYLVTGENVRTSAEIKDSEGEHNLLEGTNLKGKIIVRPEIVADLENPHNDDWLKFVDKNGKVMYLSSQNAKEIPAESDNTQESLEVKVVETTTGGVYASNGTNQKIKVATVIDMG